MKVVSSQLVAIINRLFTAIVLVALLIACQEMPESSDFTDINIEHSDSKF